jgi:serine/threonine-protein kinase PRP4
MAKAAVKELRILRMLKSNNTTGGNTFCVELLDKFEHLNHTTFVFEYLDLNLRETLHKFGRNVGIAIAAVRTYTKQLLCALQHLANHGVVHADIKPDNILVSANYGMVKLCDFGSAFLESEYMETDPTPYLVSRFYRPPEVRTGSTLVHEFADSKRNRCTYLRSTLLFHFCMKVILGLEYDKSIDLWSLAVTLAELFTGSVLFPGNTNNDMLRRFMDCLGPFSNKMLRRHFLSYQKLKLQPHFDPEDYRFKQQTFDKVTGKPVIQHVHVSELRSTSSKKQLVQVLLKAKSSSDDHGTVLKFSDLLGRCLALDPHKRISIHDALSHDFISAAAKKTTVS